MFSLLACPVIGGRYVPDPWVEFSEQRLRPFLELNLLVGLALIALAAVGALLLGLFGDLSPSERTLCGALPMVVGVAAFVCLVFAEGPAWWDTRTAEKNAVVPLAWTVSALGALVVARRQFIADESLHLQRGHLSRTDDE